VSYNTEYCCISPSDHVSPIPNPLRRQIKDKVSLLLREIAVIPYSIDEKDVPAVMLSPFVEKTIVVKDHKVSFL
jgi:hypothetical protein